MMLEARNLLQQPTRVCSAQVGRASAVNHPQPQTVIEFWIEAGAKFPRSRAT
jgi:hypothetical protein